MSYSLSISGHHGDPDVASEIDDLVEARGRELVAEIQSLDPAAVASATFSGPTGSANLLEGPETDPEAG